MKKFFLIKWLKGLVWCLCSLFTNHEKPNIEE